METTKNYQPKIYVGTYAKYNSGSLFGEWIDLTDFNDITEFYNYCYKLHKDEHDPELMFQDWEYIPKNCIGESFLDKAIFEFLNLENHIQKEVLIYQNATGYNFTECLENYENMFYFHKDDTEQMFYEFYPNLKEFENNPYINIDFERFTDDYTEVESENEIYYVEVR
jgi:hypothetical protein